MLGRLLALFLITPVVELALLIQLGDAIGFWPTIGIILITGVAGSLLARREGLTIWKRFNGRLRNGELPGKELLDGVIILTAGALLITPGVLTDVAGFVGLLPFTRAHIRKYLNRRIQRAVSRGSVRLTFGGFEHYQAGSIGRDTDVPGPDETWGGRGRDVPRHSENG